MKKLYRFHWNCGRMGDLYGTFVAEEKDIKNILNEEIYFGEVLGKHSEIFGILKEEDLEILSDDQKFILSLEEVFESKTISGYNPLEYCD